jgi:glyoxylase-like metal-dependent hydrolase (beta-lactamase superfamily II)/ferredoxin
MANLEKLNSNNVPGSLYVDTTCIDCGTCYHLAPGIFKEKDDRSFVAAQPTSTQEWVASKAAMVSCPTNSIGVMDAPLEFKEARISLPHLIAANVYYCGYTSKDSYGASSYLIAHPDGNILIDGPRFHPQLVKELEALGGVKAMLLTHQDDVADHELFHAHFGCERYLHVDDINKDTELVEHQLQGEGPRELFKDLFVIPTPGHSRGHVVYLYKNEYLFTGDHIFFDQEQSKLSASKNVCWYSWAKQMESTEKLLTYSFEWVLPGHGGWGYKARDSMKNSMLTLIQDMKAQS